MVVFPANEIKSPAASSSPGASELTSAHSSARYVLELRELSRRVDSRILVDSISLQVLPGEILALIGPSGAGKSSLLRLLNRLDEPTDGTVLVEGVDYRHISPPLLRRKVGMVLQSAYLFPGSVRSNLAFGPAQREEVLADSEVNALLEQVGLPKYADHDVATLSGGEAQRVSLARTLANEPSILLLDEPTSALDEESTRGVELLIKGIVSHSKIPCLIVTHNPAQAARLADRALYMENGRQIALGPAKEIVDAHAAV